MNGKGHADSQHRTAMKEWSCSEGACKRNKKVAQRKTITSKEMPWQLLVKRNMFIKGNQRMENTFHQPTEVKVWNDGYRALSHSLCVPHKPVRVEHSSWCSLQLRCDYDRKRTYQLDSVKALRGKFVWRVHRGISFIICFELSFHFEMNASDT